MTPGASAQPAAVALHQFGRKPGSAWSWKITVVTCLLRSLNFMKDSRFLSDLKRAVFSPWWLPCIHSRVSFRHSIALVFCASLTTVWWGSKLRGTVDHRCVYMPLVVNPEMNQCWIRVFQLLHMRSPVIPDITLEWPDHSNGQALGLLLRCWASGGRRACKRCWMGIPVWPQ